MEKVAVLGIGPSLDLFYSLREEFQTIIGVNDIYAYVETDVVVCLDHRVRFDGKRLKTIEQCQPKAFYSQIQSWSRKKGFVKIEFLSDYPDNRVNIHHKKYVKSFCSPFVACQVAWRDYKAEEIHLFGVDMINHPHLQGRILQRIVRHFKLLKSELSKEGCKMVIYGDGVLKNI